MKPLVLLSSLVLALLAPLFSIAQCGTSPASGLTTISTANQIINSYYPGTGNPITGQTSLTVGALDGRGNSTPLSNGDLVLIIQMQGADLNTNNTDAYGNGVAGAPASGALSNNLFAGYYEYNTVSSVSGATVNLAYSLVNNYYTRAFSAGNSIRSYQVIRVPRYYNLTIDAAGSVTAPAWNGSTGGIVVLDAANVMTINGSVTVAGLGFRGGGGKQFTGATTGNSNGTTTLQNTDYRFNSPITNAANLSGAAKGESIAGRAAYTYINGAVTVQTEANEGYVNGSMGRGAPANGGGGSTDGIPIGTNNNQYNTGGGGGANAGDGGMGGSGWHGGSGNVSTYPYGGHGGAAFPAHSLKRLIMGGGGGAGSANNSTGANEYQSSGGPGGGIIISRAGSYAGNGSLNANGAPAPGINGNPTSNTDAAGGGGAGGTVVLVTRQAGAAGTNSLTVTATGGAGGNMANYYDHGPGGGGGGGIIYTNGTLGSGNVGGGSNGVTRTGSAGGTLNNSFGATSGTAGQVVSFPNSVPTLVNATNPASPCGVLPVKLSSFRGLIQPGGVTLMWDIENAVDLHHFNIEYSTDGRTFQQTGTRDYVAGKTAYDFLHALNLPQVLYYRLKMVDADGVFTYSKIITLRTNRSGGSLLLYPNPAKEAVTLQVKASASDDATISVIDAAGRRVMQKNTVVQKGDNVIGLEVQSLQSGLYTVEISLKNGNTFRERLRVIKN